MDDAVIFYNERRIPIDSNYRKNGQYPYYGATGIIDYVDDYIFDGEYVLLAEDGVFNAKFKYTLLQNLKTNIAMLITQRLLHDLMWRNKNDSLVGNARLLLSSGFLALIHACRGSMSN